MSFFDITKQSTFEFVIRELTVSGFQYGHKFSQWNSVCLPGYLFLYYSLSYISFNLFTTFTFLRRAVVFLRQISGRGARILFAEGHHFLLVKALGNSLLRDKIIGSFLSYNWLGGTLTNWFTLVKKNKRFLTFGKAKNVKITNYASGVAKFRFLPNVLFLFSLTTAPAALLEANRLSIPTVAVADSDVFSLSAVYPIFGNDNSAGSLYYLLFLIASARVAGRFRKFKFFNFVLFKYLNKFLCQYFLSLFKKKLYKGFFYLLKFLLLKARKFIVFLKAHRRGLKSFFLKLKNFRVVVPFKVKKDFKFFLRLTRLKQKKKKRVNRKKKNSKFFLRRRYGLLLFFSGYTGGFKKSIISFVALFNKMKYRRLYKYRQKGRRYL